MARILIVEPLLTEAIQSFKSVFSDKHQIDYLPNIPVSDIAKTLISGKYDALIVRNKIISREIIETWSSSMKGAKLIIVRAGSNLSTIDLNAAEEYSITVTNTPGANSAAVAQYIITQMFILAGNCASTFRANNDIRSGVIKPKQIYHSHTFTGDTLAVIGTGAIGSKVSKVASSIGMIVKGYSPHFTQEHADNIGAIHCSSLSAAMEGADFISIQVPFTLDDTTHYPKTLGMINYDLLKLVNEGAKLINISRCNVVNITDLETAFNCGNLSAISFDLLHSEIENLKQNAEFLFNNSKNIITPLIACESYKADKEITTQALNKAYNFLLDR
jgi:D-3-phosphoglycerate dehydrogenase